jgi:DNA polymerase zeta
MFLLIRRGLSYKSWQSGVIMVKDSTEISNLRFSLDALVDEEDSELDLINRLTDLVREFDPDILSGYEVQSSSWGYVIERARLQFGNFYLCTTNSRI